MGDDGALDDVVECKVEDVATWNVPLVIGGRRDGMWVRTAEAEAGCTELGNALLFESGDDFIEGWAGLVCAMVGEPSHEIERGRL